jgi:UDP-N-acetyl-2-amino-2-deoxyglucuronate dehydrogenase
MSVSRREVIGTLPALGAAALQAQSKPLGVGIIGLGNRSSAHLPALKQLSDYKITAICDIQPDRMEKVNDQLPSRAATYVDYRELIRDPNVGVVVIVTPGYLHHDMAIAALRAGKDLVLEKPIAVNYRDALDIQREAERSGRIVAVGMQRRYSNADAELQAAIDDGMIGPVRLITYSEYRGDWLARSWQYTDPATGQKANWRNLKKTAGSTELEFCVHAFACVCNMVKAPLARLSATGGVVHYRDGRDTRDMTAILVEFANGARLNYSFSCFAQGAPGSMVVVGDQGVLHRDRGGQLLCTRGGKAAPVSLPLHLGDGTPEVRLYREFLENVRARKSSVIGPAAAIEPAKIAYGADISITENRIVTAKDFA